MTLTEAELIARKAGIGASEARRIVEGDWHSLWMEKTGRKEPDDLSEVFAVLLGQCTEQLNLDWTQKKIGSEIGHRGAPIISSRFSFVRCTLDGFATFEGQSTVIEAKHVNGFSKMDEVVARYNPQLQHQMICTKAPQAILSVIIGTNEPVRELVTFDEFFAEEYLEKCREFWGYVERDEEPKQGAPAMVVAPVAPTVMRKIDMTGSNEWAAFAADWLANKAAAKKFDDAVDGLKALVPEDCSEAKGHGVVASRTKRGISIKEIKK